MNRLVPGRDCGGCTVCCRVPPVDSDDFQKQSGVLCHHCHEGEGCGIHATRPVVCRDWYCGWRVLPNLGDEWRPDRSEILIVPEYEDIPGAFVERPGLKFVITGSHSAALQPRFIKYVAALVDADIPVFLSLPGPPGYFFAKAFLNFRLKDAALRRDGRAILAVLQDILRVLPLGGFEKVVLQDRATVPARDGED